MEIPDETRLRRFKENVILFPPFPASRSFFFPLLFFFFSLFVHCSKNASCGWSTDAKIGISQEKKKRAREGGQTNNTSVSSRNISASLFPLFFFSSLHSQILFFFVGFEGPATNSSKSLNSKFSFPPPFTNSNDVSRESFFFFLFLFSFLVLQSLHFFPSSARTPALSQSDRSCPQ